MTSWKWLVSSTATLLTLIISVVNITHQYLNLCKPKLQLCICRILTMIPVYVVISYISYILVEYAAPLNILRDCYEGYVMFSFLQLLIIYMGGDQVILSVLESKKISPEIWPHHHISRSLGISGPSGNFKSSEEISVNIGEICPGCFGEKKNTQVSPEEIGGFGVGESGSCHLKIARFYSFIKLGVLQFVILKPISALLSLFLESIGLYGCGSLSLKRGFVYIALVNSISVSISVYSLFLLYISISEQLKPIRPVLKFFCIKLIIFVSFWQSIILSILSYSGIYPNEPNYTIKFHNWLLTIEMVFCAIIYGIAFTVKSDFKTYIESTEGPLSDFSSQDYFHPDHKKRVLKSVPHLNSPKNGAAPDSAAPSLSKLPPRNSCTQPSLGPKQVKLIMNKIARIMDPKDIIQDTINAFKFLKQTNKIIRLESKSPSLSPSR
ncbi:DUF300-domain-containing protein [Cryptosporidium felis]|nr:DUF300-domain-containing protein [Cryptosporidium felis]